MYVCMCMDVYTVCAQKGSAHEFNVHVHTCVRTHSHRDNWLVVVTFTEENMKGGIP